MLGSVQRSAAQFNNMVRSATSYSVHPRLYIYIYLFWFEDARVLIKRDSVLVQYVQLARGKTPYMIVV